MLYLIQRSRYTAGHGKGTCVLEEEYAKTGNGGHEELRGHGIGRCWMHVGGWPTSKGRHHDPERPHTETGKALSVVHEFGGEARRSLMSTPTFVQPKGRTRAPGRRPLDPCWRLLYMRPYRRPGYASFLKNSSLSFAHPPHSVHLYHLFSHADNASKARSTT